MTHPTEIEGGTARLPTDKRRAALLEAARTAFASSGLAGTTMRDIGKIAGVDHAIVYRHFDSKEHLFEAALVEPVKEALTGWAQFSQRGIAYIGDGEPDRERGADELARVVRAVAETAQLLGVILFSERGPAFYRDHFAPTIAQFIEGIEAAKPRWQHRDFAPELPAAVVLGSSLLIGVRAAFGDDVPDDSTFARDLQDLILDGLRAPRPSSGKAGMEDDQ